MASITEVGIDSRDAAKEAARAARTAKIHGGINKAATYLGFIGLGWLGPIMKIAAGDSPKHQAKELWGQLAVPLIAILAFLGAWGAVAPQVQTSSASAEKKRLSTSGRKSATRLS